MPLPGDVQRFPGNPALRALAEDVAQRTVRGDAGIEVQQTPGETALRVPQTAYPLARFDAQAPAPPSPPGAPQPNKWSWTEMLGRADGQVVERPAGQ
jgi:hypothetical protein